MKKLAVLLLALILVFSLSACGKEKDPGAVKPGEDVQSSSKDEDKGIGADENLLTVDITIPAELLGEDATGELTEEQKSQGFKSAKLNEDGSMTLTISKANYKDFMKEYRKSIAEGLDSISTSGDYPSIKKLEYNDDFSKVTMTVDKASYEGSFDGFANLAIGMSGMIYQAFDVDIDQPRVEIDIKDEATGEIFDNVVYPDDIEE